MFQSARPNSPLFILYKNKPMRLETGYVVNQPMPKPKYTIPQNFGQPQEMIVDLVAKVGDSTLNLNGIPANLDIADSFSNGESIVISTSKEAINSEVLSIKQKSIDVVNSVDYNKEVIEQCDVILGQLYPEYAEKQVQKEEISIMKTQMNELNNKVDKLVEMMLSKQRNHE